MLPTMIVTDRKLDMMNAIEKIFPSATNLLCRWHISRNVLANCKRLFEANERWEAFNSSQNVLVFSATEQKYIQHLNIFQSDYTRYPKALVYVKQTWLDKYKEKFITAWTDFIMHFGNMTTNR